ncbi:MAG: tetratricopeptide repeat protein [Phycisphaerales bacterium]
MSNSERLQNVLAGASELPREQREAYLDAACRGDAALRSEVQSLLKSHDEAGRFLADPTAHLPASAAEADTIIGGAATVADVLREGPGTKIGPYKLLQLIGEGGFGSVFMAEQEKPVARKVALKIIKLGMDTRQVIARFEAERQALAMMDHPHIARVLDAGATETGRPFFVMELVKGDPIVEYCDKNNLSIEDRLELFAQVCNAVQHAHTKGIIHRDIKPSNILVSTQDGRSSAKVIDFGIAKATASKLTEKTLFTEHRQLIGTPEYMSPEQAEGSMDIDTRTDVYSLGVLLYELLTGTTPFSGKDLRSAAYAEIQRIIREVEPPKPSTRISQNTDTIASVAAKRHTEPKRLGTVVRGELDWIVMKALEKDRQRRYETANGLAMDIRRYLTGEAVLAAPPSTAYRFKKFIRRNRAMVSAAGAVAVALMVGMIAFAWQASIADQQRIIAQDNEQKAVDEAKRADAAKQEEAKARQRAETISEFVITALKSGDAQNSGGVGATPGAGRNMTILAAMDNALRDIDSGRFKDDPETEAELRGTIGVILRNNGQYDRAQPLLEQALARRERLSQEDDPLLARSLDDLAALYQAQGKYAQGEPLYKRALSILETTLGPYHPSVANNLNNLGLLHSVQGSYDKAEPLYRRALAIYEKAFGEDHADTARVLNNLGAMHFLKGQFAQAEPLSTRALAIHEKTLGPDHPNVAADRHMLALLKRDQGKYGEAEPLFLRTLASIEKAVGREHPSTLTAVGNLGVNYKKAGRLADAIPLLEEVHRASDRHPQFSQFSPELLDAYAQVADPTKPETIARAMALMQEVLAGARATQPKDSTQLAGYLGSLGQSMLTLKAWDEAESLIREALAIREAKQPDDWRTFNTRSMLGGVLLGRNKLAEAEPLLLAGYEGMKQREGAIPPQGATRIPEALERLVRLYEAKGDEPEAVAWRSKLEAARAEQAKAGAEGTK